MEPIVKTPIYRESATYARAHGELDQFRNSTGPILPVRMTLRMPLQGILTECNLTRKP